MINTLTRGEEQLTTAIEALRDSPKLNVSKTIFPLVGGKPFIKVISAFLKDFEASLTLTNVQLTQQQKKSFCHKLKSASANVGAFDLASLCADNEAELLHGNIDIDDVLNEFNHTYNFLRTTTSSIPI